MGRNRQDPLKCIEILEQDGHRVDMLAVEQADCLVEVSLTNLSKADWPIAAGRSIRVVRIWYGTPALRRNPESSVSIGLHEATIWTGASSPAALLLSSPCEPASVHCCSLISLLTTMLSAPSLCAINERDERDLPFEALWCCASRKASAPF